MKGIYITAEELEALHGCGPLATCIYLWLRSWMDLRSGMVGASRPISRGMLGAYTETHVPKGAGTQVVQASVKDLRLAEERLLRAGLLARAGGGEKLVFRLPMALAPQYVQNEPGINRAGEPGTSKAGEPGSEPGSAFASGGAGFEREQGREPGTNNQQNRAGGERAYRANIRDQSKPSTPQAASVTVTGVGADDVQRFAADWSAARSVAPAPVDEALQRRATELAVALRKLGVTVTAMSPYVQDWAKRGVTVPQAEEAARVAAMRREADGSTQPVGPGYLDAILRDVLNPPKPKARDQWWVSDQAMDAKARELGIATARPGESAESFKARIAAAIRLAEGAGA